MKNILTFDIEQWYHVNYKGVDISLIKKEPTELESEVKQLLDLCKKYQATATFFILGEVAEQNPGLVTLIASHGHAIASHGYHHQLVYRMSKEEFRADLKKSIDVLEPLVGKVRGYRAPSWSFNEKTPWAYEVLADLGFEYSSSVFPIKTFLYGMPGAPRFPYRVDVGQGRTIREFPMSTGRMLGKNIPFSGGAYLRLLPLFFIKQQIKELNRQDKPAIVYLHPREINKHQHYLCLPLKERIIHYVGVSKTKDKLESLLQKIEFSSIESQLP